MVVVVVVVVVVVALVEGGPTMGGAVATAVGLVVALALVVLFELAVTQTGPFSNRSIVPQRP